MNDIYILYILFSKHVFISPWLTCVFFFVFISNIPLPSGGALQMPLFLQRIFVIPIWWPISIYCPNITTPGIDSHTNSSTSLFHYHKMRKYIDLLHHFRIENFKTFRSWRWRMWVLWRGVWEERIHRRELDDRACSRLKLPFHRLARMIIP